MPERLQRRRTKGYRLPENAVSVTRPGRYGNPYRVGEDCAYPETAVTLYRKRLEIELLHNPELLEPLRGKDLACWCNLESACHADVLLELANRPRPNRPDDA